MSVMIKTVNLNQGRIKQLIEGSLIKASLDNNYADLGLNYENYKFDALPENHIFNDNMSINIKCYDVKTGKVLAMCSIRERYLKLIYEGVLEDVEHEYNLFKKYAEVFSVKTNDSFYLGTRERM